MPRWPDDRGEPQVVSQSIGTQTFFGIDLHQEGKQFGEVIVFDGAVAECGPCVVGVVGVCGDVAYFALDDDFAGFDNGGGGGGGGNFVAHD